jgi:Trypsin
MKKKVLTRSCWPHTISPLALGDGPPTARAGHAAGLRAACTQETSEVLGGEMPSGAACCGEGRLKKFRAVPRCFLLSLGLMLLLSPVVTHASDSSTRESLSHVVLGTLEPNYNFPWVVKVLGSLTCHGTLIADQWVLTAAHCLYQRFSGVTVTYTRTTPEGIVTSGSLQTGQNSVFVHPDYNIHDFNHDIGLVKLPMPFAPDPFLQAAALPLDVPWIGQQGTVAAQTATPGQAAVLRGPIVLTGGHSFFVNSPTASLCPGDSGSGFVVQAGGSNVVMGVVANTPTSNNCTEAGWEFEAMSVHAYADWIRSHTGIEPPVVGNGTRILWRHTNGQVAIWFMDGGTIVGEAYPGGQDPGLTWEIQGVGDFDNDGHSDILWRHVSGQLAIWFKGDLAGAAYPGWENYPWPVELAWQVQGVGDFDGDARADILWRHSNGQVSIWFMDGGVRVGDSFPGGQDPSLFWKIQAVGDFDGNLRADILWRDANGLLGIWFGGETGFDAPSYNNVPGPVDLSWQVQGVGDFDHDGRDDILWRQSNGQVAIWLMDGVRFVGDVYPRWVDTTWQIKGLLHE